mgnify:CR=1 FL=1
MRKKRKTVWAFLDGKKLVDVVQAALDNNMMVDDLKAFAERCYGDNWRQIAEQYAYHAMKLPLRFCDGRDTQ